jgi:predicted  nucleic acid-binding Zn-ribbon protein
VSSSNSQRLEELEDQLSGLRKEREQLYAQIQADSVVKKFQEQKIRDLETSSGGTPGGPQADSTGGSAGGAAGSEHRVRELEKECNGLRDQLEATEIKLAEERSRHQQEVRRRNARGWWVGREGVGREGGR